MVIKELQPSNAPYPIWVTDFGMVKLLKELQSRNASSPIVIFADSGMVRLVNELQQANAPDPIWVTDFGMTSRNKQRQPSKANGMMDVSVLGMRMPSKSFTLQPDAFLLTHSSAGLDVEDNLQPVAGQSKSVLDSDHFWPQERNNMRTSTTMDFGTEPQRSWMNQDPHHDNQTQQNMKISEIVRALESTSHSLNKLRTE